MLSFRRDGRENSADALDLRLLFEGSILGNVIFCRRDCNGTQKRVLELSCRASSEHEKKDIRTNTKKRVPGT